MTCFPLRFRTAGGFHRPLLCFNTMNATLPQDAVRDYLMTLPLPALHPALEHRRSRIAGYGIHATKDIPAGTVLVSEHGPIVDDAQIDIVAAAGFECELRVGWGLYSLHRPVHGEDQGGYINHSCNPNAGLVDVRTFAAIRDIACGEEVTCDYGTFETATGWTLQCQCGASNCRGVITGRDFLLPVLKERLGQYYAPYLRDPKLTRELRCRQPRTYPMQFADCADEVGRLQD